MNNKVLLLILAGLLAIFGITRFLSGGDENSFDPVILSVPQESINRIVMKPKADIGKEVTLQKTDDTWMIHTGDKTFDTDQASIDQLLSQLSSVKTSYIAAKNKDKWPEYELEADKASHIRVYDGEKKLADFYVGKFSVNQQAQQITSYFRVDGKEDVYAVEGMAGMMLGQSADAYRNKQLLKLAYDQVESLKYEGDSPYRVDKQNGAWLLDQSVTIDSARAKNFLMNLLSIEGDQFANDFNPETSGNQLLKELTISGSNMPQPVVVRCWQVEAADQPFVINSSQYPDAYFASDSSRIFKRIFKTTDEW